jgi:hypothetical protein
VIDHFQQQEHQQEQQLRALDITIEEAGKDDFAAAISDWEKIWSAKAKSLPKLRQAAAAIKGN